MHRLALKIVAYTKKIARFSCIFLDIHTFSAYIDAIVIYFIMSLTKCTECNILPTHYKYIVYKLILVYLKYYDRQGISNLNIIICKSCQIHEASIILVQLSESSSTLTKKSSSKENNAKASTDLITEEDSSLSRIITVNITII